MPRSWWHDPAATAAANGDTESLLVFHQCGLFLKHEAWAKAAEQGHVNCLLFALDQGYQLRDSVLEVAVCNGHLACVELLVQRGLPQNPYLHSTQPPSPAHKQCIQLMINMGVEIDRQTLVIAANRGDLNFVRWLFERGVPLWQ